MVKSRLIALVFSCIGLFSCASTSIQQYSAELKQSESLVYVIDHGYHSALVVPSQPLVEQLGLQHSVLSPFRFIEIGRGDASYYQTENPGMSTALKALFVPTPAVLHLAAYDAPPHQRFPLSEVREIEFSKAQLSTLYRLLFDEFELVDSKPLDLAQGRNVNSRFYRALGSYHLFYTSNNWTADMLRQAGYPIVSATAFFSDSVIDQIDRINKVMSGQCHRADLICDNIGHRR